MTDKQYDCVIIGGGISGISFAHYLHQQGKNILVLEKEDVIGGQIYSPVSKTDSNYWRELGAHTCYNSYTHLLSIVRDLQGEEQIQPLGKGSFKIYANGKIRGAMSQIEYISLITNGLKIFFSSREGKTVKEYFGNIVGKKNYNHLFTRLFRAVLSQNADDYPAQSFLKRRDGRFKEFPRKYSFSKGLHTILDMMVEKNKLEVATNTEVIDIQKDEIKNYYNIVTIDGHSFSASNIAFATPPHITARLIGEVESDLANLLGTIPMFYSESMNVIVSKKKLSLEAVAGIIPMSDEFHSAVSRDLVEDENLRSFTFHFPHNAKDEDEKIALICQVLDIKEQDIIESIEDKHILPSLRLQHLDIADQVTATKQNDNVYILGNYFYGLSLEDCVNRSSDEAKRFLAANHH